MEVVIKFIAAQLQSDMFPDGLSPAMENLYSNCCTARGGRQATLDETIDLIETVSVTMSNSYLVLDALDECQDRSRLLQVINTLRKTATNLKFFVTSRREPDIMKALTEDTFQEMI